MKTLKYISPLFIVAILLIQACGGDKDKETAEEAFVKQISGSWQMASADFDGKDVTESFPGLVVNITGSKSITVQNAVPPMWKASSTFTLLESGGDFIINRNDGLVMSVSQVTDTKLILTFDYDADAMGGRTGSVSGSFTFEFDKN